MTAELSRLQVRSVREWRTWLRKHHRTSPGVWLVFPKKHTGAQPLSYEEAVREALCVGWIDSLVKRLDDDRFARKFTPRSKTSKWSAINRRRWAELRRQGLLAPAGLAAAPSGNSYGQRPRIPQLPAYLAKALRVNPRAWAFFQQLAPSYRRHFVAWIHIARRPETRLERIREALALLEAGKKLGLK
jgi:uncharacterized protein YdeI (YjbR/CyaY-like superfamily)